MNQRSLVDRLENRRNECLMVMRLSYRLRHPVLIREEIAVEVTSRVDQDAFLRVASSRDEVREIRRRRGRSRAGRAVVRRRGGARGRRSHARMLRRDGLALRDPGVVANRLELIISIAVVIRERHDLLDVVQLRWGGRWGPRPPRGREPRAPENEIAELRDADPLGRIALEDASEDLIQLGGEREDGTEETGILEVGPEGGILGRGPFPGIPPTGQIYEDDAETPDVVGC